MVVMMMMTMMMIMESDFFLNQGGGKGSSRCAVVVFVKVLVSAVAEVEVLMRVMMIVIKNRSLKQVNLSEEESSTGRQGDGIWPLW